METGKRVKLQIQHHVLLTRTFYSTGWCLHEWLLTEWGTPIGEMWDLETLSKVCEKEGRWTFFLTSAPLHVKGGVGTFELYTLTQYMRRKLTDAFCPNRFSARCHRRFLMQRNLTDCYPTQTKIDECDGKLYDDGQLELELESESIMILTNLATRILVPVTTIMQLQYLNGKLDRSCPYR
jgi:hypothetical protein